MGSFGPDDPGAGPPDEKVTDPRFVAACDVIGKTGATHLQIRWSDDEEPTVWFAVAVYKGGAETDAALHPADAVARLAERLVDGALCVHCGRPTGLEADWQARTPLASHICWYVYDPEVQKFRRDCEGEHERRIGRNDPCPCGSGAKFKRCHGALLYGRQKDE